jgi:hypothetical protein
MAAAKSPAYQRRFSISQNHSATYFTRAIVAPDIQRALGKVEMPRTLRWRQQQLRIMATATQMNRRALELEKFVAKRLKDAHAEHERIKGEKPDRYPVLLAMQPDEYVRWCYCREAARRADETASRLEAQLFERLERLRSESASARLSSAEL